MGKLTQGVVREYCRTLGGTFKHTQWDDYKVAFGQGDARQEYFCNDLLDCIETARVMKGSHPGIEQAEEYLKGEGF